MDLKLEAKQTQTLSQHMIQSAKILQMTAQELNTYVSDLALENPVIDITEPAAAGRQESIEQQQWLNSFNEENYYLYQRQNNDDDYDFRDSWNIDSTDGETLQDYLWSQLVAENFSEEDTAIIKFMLECLDNKAISANPWSPLPPISTRTNSASRRFLSCFRSWTPRASAPGTWKNACVCS